MARNSHVPDFNSTRRRAVVVGLALTLSSLGLLLPTVGSATPTEKVTICHADASISHPYVVETVSADSISDPHGNPLPNGHGTHTGGVFPTRHWGDIIPPIPSLNYPGLNWTGDGTAIWQGGCVVEEMPPNPEPTPTPTPTPTSSEPESSTSVPETSPSVPGSTRSTPS